MAVSPVVLIHGGAGAWAKIEQDGVPKAVYEDAMKEAALAGNAALVAGGSAVDAVEAAVAAMEDNPVCNAGRGSCLTLDGEVEMDASIMDGSNLALGGVATVTNIANPIKLARIVMEKSPHVLFAGPGAMKFAKQHGVEQVSTSSLIVDHAVERLKEIPGFKTSVVKEFHAKDAAFQSPSDHDTVGAVALDKNGNTAYATSTGGISAKLPGRVGDSPIGGCGGYAENSVGCCSTTGSGEAILKFCLGRMSCLLMEQGLSPQAAVEHGLTEMCKKVGGSGGCIAVDSKGNLGIHYTTPGMGWAYAKESKLHYGIYHGEDFIEKII